MDNAGTAVQPRTVATGRGTAWISEGFELFRRAPGLWIGMIVIWFVVSTVASLLPAGGLISGFLNPIFEAGLMLGCASLAGGSALRVEHLFSGFTGGRIGQLLLLGAFTLLLGIALVIVGAIVLVATVGGINELKAPDAYGLVPVMLTVLIVLALSVPLVMAVWFAPALIVLRNVAAWDAMKLSFRGCLMNLGPFLVYGIVAIAIVIVACIPLFLGLLIAVPVLVASAYTGYRDIFPA